jgi:predicted unusual protein kinase regulating ubiquinone biosynthesis (AarF/ABC1/UbiB family)
MPIAPLRRDPSIRFVDVTMHRDSPCDQCGALLSRGARACIGVDEATRARHVLCPHCRRPEEPSDVRPTVPPVAALAFGAPVLGRGSLAVWIAVGVVGVAAVLASRTGRRVVATAGVAAKVAGGVAVARIRGRTSSTPALVREAFEDLGPTYIKLGQLVASSQGLFPEPYCQEFRKCLDRVRPFGFADVERILRAELERDPQAVFDSIDPMPLASASIAQVHAARLRDGRDVVIKVQRPHIREIVDADLRVLRLGARAFALLPHGGLANPVGVVEDFEANIRAELDFRLEADNMEEFNRIMAAQGQARVAAPRAMRDLSSRRVLVMERFFGRRVDDLDPVRAPHDRAAAGARGGVTNAETRVAAPEADRSSAEIEERLLLGMRAWFQCMILHGFFHGDVHAGNLMALDDGRVGFLDFGIVGRFSPERRRQVTEYLLALATGDFHRLADIMVRMGSIDRAGVDLERLSNDLAAAYEPLLGNALSPAKYADIIPTILRKGIEHGMRMPRDFVLVVKQMLYFDRYAKLLAPNLNVFRDPRIVSGLMEDIAAAAAAPGSPFALCAPRAEPAARVASHDGAMGVAGLS